MPYLAGFATPQDYGALGNGVQDDTPYINDALAANGLVFLPPGTYLLNDSSPVSLAVAFSKLIGAGRDSTFLQLGSSFSASAAVSVAGQWCDVRGLSIIGASSTITSNPAANGVELTGSQFCTIDVAGQYINGWLAESVGSGATANTGTRFVNPTAYNCAGGLHVKGVSGSSFGGQQWITNPHFSQIGVSSGASANLDGIMVEDASDVYIAGYDGAISDVGTGSTLHVKGLCASVFVDTYDLGCFPNGSPNNSILKIEDSSNGSPAGIHFGQGILQQGLVGATVSGGASRVYFDGTDFANNSTHGCVLSGTGSGIYFGPDTTFRGNGSGASGTNYDLDISGSATGIARGAHFLSPVTTTGVSGVQNVVNVSAGQNFPFEDCDFSGSGAALSNIFANQPTWVRNCRGWNPHGSITQSVPSSSSSTTALHYDAYFYITAGSGSCSVTRNTNGFGGGGGPAITIPAGACVPVFVRAGGTLTFTYTSTPTSLAIDGV